MFIMTIHRLTVPGTSQVFITFIVIIIILPLFCPQHHLLQVPLARNVQLPGLFLHPQEGQSLTCILEPAFKMSLFLFRQLASALPSPLIPRSHLSPSSVRTFYSPSALCEVFPSRPLFVSLFCVHISLQFLSCYIYIPYYTPFSVFFWLFFFSVD